MVVLRTQQILSGKKEKSIKLKNYENNILWLCNELKSHTSWYLFILENFIELQVKAVEVFTETAFIPPFSSDRENNSFTSLRLDIKTISFGARFRWK